MEIRHCPHSFVCLHICVHVCVHGYMCACVAYVCTCANLHVFMWTCMCMYVCTWVYACLCVHVYVYAYVGTYVPVCMYTETREGHLVSYSVTLLHSLTELGAPVCFPLTGLAESKSQWFSFLCLLNVWTAGIAVTHPAYYIDIGIWSPVLMLEQQVFLAANLLLQPQTMGPVLKITCYKFLPWFFFY